MSTTQTQQVKSNVEQVDVNLDEIFNAAPSGADMISDDSSKPKNIFSGLSEKADMSFADPDKDDKDDLNAKVENNDESDESSDTNEPVAEENANDILNTLDGIEEEDENNFETKTKKGRKSINGISDVFSKLINDKKIFGFDDDKDLDDYSAKDWAELIEVRTTSK